MTTKKAILEIFNNDKKRLFSLKDIAAALGEPFNQSVYKRIENTVRNFRISKHIHRHKDKNIEGKFQYAVEMDEERIDPWVLNTGMSADRTGVTRQKPLKKKLKLLSKKEIQSMFAAQYNMLALLEDEAMKIIDEFEITDKEMAKIRNFIGR